jgi:hypothetical protein
MCSSDPADKTTNRHKYLAQLLVVEILACHISGFRDVITCE